MLGPCHWAQCPGRDLETVYPTHEHSIFKLEMEAHLSLVNCEDSGSQVMQCNKHVLWLAALVDCSSQNDSWAYHICTLCQFTEQISVLHFEIENHEYNSSLFRSSSWLAVEKSRSHRHGRISFIVNPFQHWSQNKPPKRLSFVVRLNLLFSMTTNWLPQK